MSKEVAIIGAGVSGLTTGVVFAESGYEVSIFAEEIGEQTTSGAAAAIWFPYDAEPADKVIPWALETYRVLFDLVGHETESPNRARDSESAGKSKLDGPKPSSSKRGVSMIELHHFSRSDQIKVPDWAHSLGAFVMSSARRAVAKRRRKVEISLTVSGSIFKSGFSINVPLTDTTIYLDYLKDRLTNADGVIHSGVHFKRLEDVDPKFDLIINCAGIGARELVYDADLEPHRGQVAIVPKIENLNCAIVCDDPPLMYAIPRKCDCVFGGTNEISENRQVDPATTSRIVAECRRVLNIGDPRILAERVGLRPFRKSGVRVERERLRDGRTVIHNYGHGGAGFTLSWGCAREVLARRPPNK